MKKISKILVVLLSLTLIISALAVFVYADESAEAAPYNYEAVLEYFETDNYLNATFDDADTLDEAFASASDKVSVSGKVSYKSNGNGTATMKSLSPLYFDVETAASVSFGLNAKLSLDAANSVLSLRLNSAKRASSANDVLKLFEVTNSTLSIYSGVENSLPVYEATDVNLTQGQMFELSVFYEKTAAGEKITLTLAPVGGQPIVKEFNANGFNFKSFDISSTYITADYFEIYGGSFARRLSDNSAEISALVNGIIAEYNKDTTSPNAYNYLETVAKVAVTYGFRDPAIVESAMTAISVVAPKYSADLASAVASINVTAGYYDALATVDNATPLAEFLNTLKSFEEYSSVAVDYDKVSESITVLDSERARIAALKEDTLLAYNAILSISNLYVANYAELKSVYDVVKAHPMCDTYYDDEYSLDSIALAARYASAIMTEFEKKDATAVAFVNAVPVMCNTELPFAERYAAYTVAKANKFTDESYDEYIDGTTVAELNSNYDAVCVNLQVEADYAEEFLLKVKEAYLTSSYAVKIVALDAAAEYIEDVEMGYPGVAESVELYNALRSDINDKITATKNYISAVLAVKNAETVEAKKAAIEIAKAYAVMGNDVSVEITDMEITVTEANIILSNEESGILLSETAVSAYVNAVAAIASKTDMNSKRQAILKAFELKNNIDSTIPELAESNAALDAATEAYNAEINSANSVAKQNNELALAAFSATVPTTVNAQIVAIIKKFYE